jgi:hypothetical protein
MYELGIHGGLGIPEPEARDDLVCGIGFHDVSYRGRLLRSCEFLIATRQLPVWRVLADRTAKAKMSPLV